MSQTQQVENEVRNDPAFRIDEINTATGETVLILQKGILGALANQLKNTSNRRKGANILRKLGYVLADCGDVQYGNDISKTSLEPELVTNVVEIDPE